MTIPSESGAPTAGGEAVSPFTDDGLVRALWWDAGAEVLHMVDQTLLPGRLEVLTAASAEEVAEAIGRLRVRGAPAIGEAAAYGLVLGAIQALPTNEVIPADAALARLGVIAGRLRSTRPTAVNLAWALERLLDVAERHLEVGNAVTDLPARLLEEAQLIYTEDAASSHALGELGNTLIPPGATLLTHCNAGALATAGIGTALAPIFVAHRSGKDVRVFVDETRPLLQGARLTAWELARAGVPLVLITDNMAAHFMRRAPVDAIFVGADRIAANGDVANKIGTYGLAVLAREHQIPLYVVAPRSTIDLSLPDGDAIPIEERAEDEVTAFAGLRLAPEGVHAANPAFDVTPARFVTAIVTEQGIVRPPFDHGLASLFQTS